MPNNICNVPGSPRSGSPTTLGNSAKHLGRVKSLPHTVPYASDSVRHHQNEARSCSPVSWKMPSDNATFCSITQQKPRAEDTCKICGCSEIDEKLAGKGRPRKSCSELTIPAMSFSGRNKPTVEEVIENARNIRNSEELDKLYDKIDDWNFPIFDVWNHGNVLRGVSCA